MKKAVGWEWGGISTAKPHRWRNGKCAVCGKPADAEYMTTRCSGRRGIY